MENIVFGACHNSFGSHRVHTFTCGYFGLAGLVMCHAWACTAKGRVTNIYTNSRYAFGVAHDFRSAVEAMQFAYLNNGNKIKNGSNVPNLLDAILLPAALPITKLSGSSRLKLLESKGNHLTDISNKTLFLRKPRPKPVMVERDVLSNDELGKK